MAGSSHPLRVRGKLFRFFKSRFKKWRVAALWAIVLTLTVILPRVAHGASKRLGRLGRRLNYRSRRRCAARPCPRPTAADTGSEKPSCCANGRRSPGKGINAGREGTPTEGSNATIGPDGQVWCAPCIVDEIPTGPPPEPLQVRPKDAFYVFLPFFTPTLPQPEVKCVEVIEAPCDDPNETAEA